MRNILVIFFMLASLSVSEAKELFAPAGIFVVRIYYETPSDIQKLFAYDIHEYNNRKERYFLATVNEELYQQLKDEGWKVKIDNQSTKKLSVSKTIFFGEYRTVEELYADMATMNFAYPNITEIVDYGEGYCKTIGGCTTLGGETQATYNLQAIKITNKEISGPKPVFFLMAGIHSREITTPEIAMRMIDWLVNGYGTNADATWLVDWHETWIVPTVNPEGHWLVELGMQPPYYDPPYYDSPFYQRKNANQNGGCTTWPPKSWSQYGVDLNRNHSFLWNTGGSSHSPCDQTYHGISAASEPEVEKLQQLVKSIIPDQRGSLITDAAPNTTTGIFITLHSYSELVLWPWANTYSQAPNNDGLQAIGEKFTKYNNYTPQQSSDLYPSSGGSADWAYGELGVPAFTFELGDSFMPPYEEVGSTQWPENKFALIYANKIARLPYKLVNGPDAMNIEFIPSISNIVTLSAVIDDSENGGQIISEAEFYIDVPYWRSNAVVNSMVANDGNFDSINETVNAEIDIDILTNSLQLVFVRGKDADGNWGPMSAIFTPEIPEPFIITLLGYLIIFAGRTRYFKQKILS